jgi:hypothetical protein
MLRSRIRSPIERLISLAGGYYRCRICQERSFVFGQRVSKPAVDRASK